MPSRMLREDNTPGLRRSLAESPAHAGMDRFRSQWFGMYARVVAARGTEVGAGVVLTNGWCGGCGPELGAAVVGGTGVHETRVPRMRGWMGEEGDVGWVILEGPAYAGMHRL